MGSEGEWARDFAGRVVLISVLNRQCSPNFHVDAFSIRRVENTMIQTRPRRSLPGPQKGPDTDWALLH